MAVRRSRKWHGWLIASVLAGTLASCGVVAQPQAADQIAAASPVAQATSAPPTPTDLPTFTLITPTVLPSPTATSAPTATSVPPTTTPAPTATNVPPTTMPTATSGPVVVNGRTYRAYIEAAEKQSQDYGYSCEFDAAWVVLNTFGIQVSVDEIIAQMPLDMSIEPRYEETANGFVIYGGDIEHAYSGDYKKNFLARSTGKAMIPVFAHFGAEATPISTRAEVEAALSRGDLVWMKMTVDFKPWRPATWIMPDGRTHQTVLGNDHAAVVIGYNDAGVVMRDVLGPTSSNWQRQTTYEVPWDRFMASWEAQSFDGLAVARPR